MAVDHVSFHSLKKELEGLVGVRAANALVNWIDDISSLDDLRNKIESGGVTEAELLRIPNLGKLSLERIRDVFPFPPRPREEPFDTLAEIVGANPARDILKRMRFVIPELKTLEDLRLWLRKTDAHTAINRIRKMSAPGDPAWLRHTTNLATAKRLAAWAFPEVDGLDKNLAVLSREKKIAAAKLRLADAQRRLEELVRST